MSARSIEKKQKEQRLNEAITASTRDKPRVLIEEPYAVYSL